MQHGLLRSANARTGLLSWTEPLPPGNHLSGHTSKMSSKRLKQHKFNLSNDTAWENFIRFRKTVIDSGKDFIVTAQGQKRNSDQNALSFAIYGQIATQLGDQTLFDVRCRCKLDFGVPILRRDDKDFDDMYGKSIALLPYEDQLRAMKWLQVTSVMGKRQFAEYIDTVIREYSMQGISIIFPGEE